MPGLVPGIHVLLHGVSKTWMAGSNPAMTNWRWLCPVEFSAGRGVKGRYVAFFGVKVALRLSNNSTFTPFRRMM